MIGLNWCSDVTSPFLVQRLHHSRSFVLRYIRGESDLEVLEELANVDSFAEEAGSLQPEPDDDRGLLGSKCVYDVVVSCDRSCSTYSRPRGRARRQP